jgi:sigma-E factor negative regulatory protein RseB
MRVFAALLLAGGLAAPAAAAESDGGSDGAVADVRAAVEAARQRSYQGILVHALASSGVETMRLYHRGGGEDQFRERVVMLTGPAHELVRDGDSLWRYRPGSERVITGPRRGGTGIFKLQAGDLERLPQYYDIRRGPKGRIAGRQARALELEARDGQRFHYRMWLDRETDLPLQTEVLDHQGEVVESFLFAVVSIGVRLQDAQVSLDLPEGVQRVRRRRRDPEGIPAVAADLRLPEGFRLEAFMEGPGEGESHHLFYSDGLASVSVFVEPEEGPDQASDGVLHRGALHAATLRRDGKRVTILGELPGPAIQEVAAGLSGGNGDGDGS